MANEPVPAALQGFNRLSPSTYIYEPPTTASTKASATDPDFILLPSWLDAQPRHISKYTTHYRELYPHARILLVTTNFPDVTYRSWPTIYADRRPSFELLLSLPKSTKILAHVFSNGGGFTIAGMAKRYRETTGAPLNLPVLILDSTPGRNHWDKSIAALAAGLPKNFLARLIGGFFVRAFLAVYMLVTLIKGGKDRIEVLRNDLNDTRLFEQGTRRLYFFSNGDKMILDKDVRDHAEEAREKGWDVKTEEFVGTQHVSHMMGDGQRYWGAVKQLWDSSI